MEEQRQVELLRQKEALLEQQLAEVQQKEAEDRLRLQREQQQQDDEELRRVQRDQEEQARLELKRQAEELQEIGAAALEGAPRWQELREEQQASQEQKAAEQRLQQQAIDQRQQQLDLEDMRRRAAEDEENLRLIFEEQRRVYLQRSMEMTLRRRQEQIQQEQQLQREEQAQQEEQLHREEHLQHEEQEAIRLQRENAETMRLQREAEETLRNTDAPIKTLQLRREEEWQRHQAHKGAEMEYGYAKQEHEVYEQEVREMDALMEENQVEAAAAEVDRAAAHVKLEYDLALHTRYQRMREHLKGVNSWRRPKK